MVIGVSEELRDRSLGSSLMTRAFTGSHFASGTRSDLVGKRRHFIGT
jgi:hypothetical protein